MRRTIISLRRRSTWRNSATLVLLGLVSMPGGASMQAARSAIQLRVPVGASPNVRWAVEKLKTQLRSAGYNLDANSGAAIEVVPGASDLPMPARKPEGFRLVATADRVRVSGFDDAGAMYGVLDLAKRVRDAGRLPENVDFSDAPAMTLRGTCVFLMKLGTYDYPVTPQEFPFFYDKPLWVQYLDFLAENRFNYIAFWNGHPFDYFVSLDRFPEAQTGMEPGLLQRNHDMLMWIANEAQRRHIWLMFQFYNIHTSVYFQKAHGLPAWNSKPTPLLTDYTAYAIERFVSEFPGIGLYICPGEALSLEYTDSWITNVIFPAVKRTGKTPPIMVRAWAIDLPHMKKVVGHYAPLYTERKFNVEMLASTVIDPENEAWAKLSGNHVVNIHCEANLEPYRWSSPTFIQKCIRSSLAAGGTGLHVYPRKVWRWPYGCDRGTQPELQWDRDEMWFEAWGRYAWNPSLDPARESEYWVRRLSVRYGNATAGAAALGAYEKGGDVLPALQRIIWLGDGNHTLISAGIKLDQIANLKGIPFDPMPGIVRIADYIQILKRGGPAQGKTPLEFLDEQIRAADASLSEARHTAAAATRNREDARRLATDAEAVLLLARFYRFKVEAAIAKALADSHIDARANSAACLRGLRASVEQYRQLTRLTTQTYDSMTDVPAWDPVRDLPCPYHWSDLLPVFEKELAAMEREARTLARR
jgi:hypothetical protein